MRARGHLRARDVEQGGVVARALRKALDVTADVRSRGRERDAEAVEHGEDESARREEGLGGDRPARGLDAAQGRDDGRKHLGHRAGVPGRPAYPARDLPVARGGVGARDRIERHTRGAGESARG